MPLIQQTIDGFLLFDLYQDDHWIGMASGLTPQDTRAFIRESWPRASCNIILIPYYGDGTSTATYEALTGRNEKSSYAARNFR